MSRAFRYALVLILIARSAGFAADTPPDALQYAKGAANWILSVSTVRDGNRTWPVNDTDKKSPAFDLYYGMPGGVLLLAELAKDDPAGSYGKVMRESISGLESLKINIKEMKLWGFQSGEAIHIPSGLYAGNAGIVWLYLELYRLTGDQRCLDQAKVTVSIMMGRNRMLEGDSVWDDSTDIISGAAGTGLLMLRAAKDLQDSRMLKMARDAGDYIVSRSIDTPAGLKWRINSAAGTVYPNFAHGTAGIAYFLLRLAQFEGGSRFLGPGLRGAMQTESFAEVDEKRNTSCWFHHEGDGEDLWYAGWCHGPVGTARLFYLLSKLSSDELPKAKPMPGAGGPISQRTKSARGNAMTWVERSANWLLVSGIPVKPVPGYWNEGMCCGTAGIGEMMLDLYSATGRKEYLQAAERMAAHLANVAERSGDGYRWVQAENRATPGKKDAQTGYSQGAAGIGLFFLKLSRVQRGVPVGWHFPDNPF